MSRSIRSIPRSCPGRPIASGRRPKAGGGWAWNVKGARPVPYRLPDLLAAGPECGVLVVEGEEDANRAAGIGIVATTCAMGAGKWRPEYNEHFRGRSVYIVPDNDKPGREHAQQVAQSLHGIAKTVKVVELPGVLEKGDLSDWLDRGGTKERLGELANAAPDWKPAPADEQPHPATAPEKPKPPPYVPFPTDVLPAVVRDLIRQGAKALGCDESYIALPLLAALASAVGNARQIELKKGSWSEPCVVWAVAVGESGTLKSPGFDLALSPLNKLQTVAFAQYHDAMERYAQDKTAYDADLLEWKKKGHKSGEPAPEPPDEPVAVRYLCADTTVEALAVLLEQQPRGLLMARDEVSGWVNSFDAYKSCRGADVAHWLSMHRAGPLTVDRKTGRKTIHVPRAAVGIAGNVQPRALAAALVGRYQPRDGAEAMDAPAKEHFDNGLAARLLFAMPPARPKQWTDDDLPAEATESIRRLFDRLLSLEMGQDDDGGLVPVDLPLTTAAHREWVKFYDAHNRELADMHGDLAAAWSKLEGYAARFALLVHLIRSVSGEADPAAVDERSIAAGVALARWFADEAARVYAVIGGKPEAPEARERRELVRILNDHGGRVTVRELMRASRRYRASAEDAEKALRGLVGAGIADAREDKHGPRGGRPVFVFTLRGSGDGDKTSATPEENGVLSPSPPDSEGKTQVVSGLSSPSDEVCQWTG